MRDMTWEEVEAQISPEVAGWFRAYHHDATEMIEAQRGYIDALEQIFLDHGILCFASDPKEGNGPT